MHEMSIAEGILDIAMDYAAQNGASRIAEIGLLIGEMSGVVEESLCFCFGIIAKDTPAEGAVIKVRRLPLLGRCGKCGRDFHVEHYDFWCPECKDGALEIISGREMQVEYLEVE